MASSMVLTRRISITHSSVSKIRPSQSYIFFVLARYPTSSSTLASLMIEKGLSSHSSLLTSIAISRSLTPSKIHIANSLCSKPNSTTTGSAGPLLLFNKMTSFHILLYLHILQLTLVSTALLHDHSTRYILCSIPRLHNWYFQHRVEGSSRVSYHVVPIILFQLLSSRIDAQACRNEIS